MKVLGIDPGLRRTGFGVVSPGRPERLTTGQPGGIILIEGGCIKLNAESSISARLTELDRDIREVLDRHRPDVVAVEMLFAHYKHPTTAIVMGHARGIILLAIAQRGLPLVELRPTEIKKSLTGHGHASKEQMQDAVAIRLGLPSRPEPADVADALAIAMCGLVRLTAEQSLAATVSANLSGGVGAAGVAGSGTAAGLGGVGMAGAGPRGRSGNTVGTTGAQP